MATPTSAELCLDPERSGFSAVAVSFNRVNAPHASIPVELFTSSRATVRVPGAARFHRANSLTSSVKAVGPEVQVLDPALEPEWDASVAGHPHGGFFHRSSWAAVLKDTYRHAPVYVTARVGEHRAMWPIMEVNSLLTGRRGVSLPFTDECEPLLHPATSPEAVLSAVCDLGRARGWRYFEFRGGQQYFPEVRPSVSFFGHKLLLDRDTEALFGRCESSVRRAVRKARQSGVRAEISQQEEAIRTYYELHCRTRKKHGLPPQPYAFFQNIHRHVISRDQGMVIVARHERRPVAAGIFFHHGSGAHYKFGAADESSQHFRANNLVMWTAIEHFALRGCQYLCFGRTSLANAGLRRYKLGWGAEERELKYYRYDYRANAFVAGMDRAAGWHNRIFRACPVFLLRWAGAMLYRHLA